MCEFISDEYLYHYTSIDVLALILKNHTIRLNSLDKMDDLQEQLTADVKNLGRFVFVSSWTDDKDESIPMWKMYTNPCSGVRIRLHKNPFAWQGTLMEDFVSKLGYALCDGTTSSMRVNTFLNIAEIMNKGYVCDQAMKGDILCQVKYTNDKTLLEPQVLETTPENFSIQVGKLGYHKSKYWDFQKEWRYIMRFIPCDFSNGPEMAALNFQITANKLARGIATPPFPYFDLNIDDRYFNDMEITCSPQMTAGNKLILDTLVAHFNPNATVRDSDLYGKL